MTARRALGTGPQAPAHSIRAAQADLLDALPGERLSDLEDLRARGVLGTRGPEAPPPPRRTLKTGGRAAEGAPGTSFAIPAADADTDV